MIFRRRFLRAESILLREGSSMALANIEEYLKLVPALRKSPSHLLWSS